jgi:hypothetical protein
VERNQPPTCRLSGWLVFALLLALLSLCYISVLVTPYALSDEYALLWARLVGAKWAQLLELAYGRPTAAILHNLIFFLMNSIGDLRYIRLLNVIIIITTLAWAVYRTLLYAGWNWHYAFFISLITATLPPFQAYASAAEDTHFLLAALATAGAFYAAEWGLKVRRPVHRWSLGAGSTLFVLLGITIVQPGAMFFWVFAAIVMFNPGTNIPYLLRRLRWYGAIFGTGLILGFGVYEMGVAMYGSMLSPERSRLTKDLFAKALWFLQWPLVDALNLVNLHSNPWLAGSVAVVGSGGMILYFRGGIGERLLKYAIALSVIPMTYLPNLITAENWSSYRTQIALAPLILSIHIFRALRLCETAASEDRESSAHWRARRVSFSGRAFGILQCRNLLCPSSVPGTPADEESTDFRKSRTGAQHLRHRFHVAGLYRANGALR